MTKDSPDFPGLTAQGKALDAVLAELEQSAGRFGTAMTSALTSAARSGKGLDDLLRSMGLRLVDIALSAGLKPLQAGLSGGIGTVFESLASGLAGAAGPGGTAGAGPAAGQAAPFFKDGTAATPAVLSGLSALAGQDPENGAASAVAKGAAASAPWGSPAAPSVVFNVTAGDVESFRRSEGQIAAMLTRAVGRGRRGT